MDLHFATFLLGFMPLGAEMRLVSKFAPKTEGI